MTKRFCDTEIWQKDWFLNLSIKKKLLVKFIFDNCDCAGIYEISYKTLKFCFDEEIKKEDFEGIKQIRFIGENTIFVEDFVLFQCGISSLNALNPNNNAHKGIIKRLEKYNFKLGASEGLVSPYIAPQEKEKEKEKDNLSSFASFLLSDENKKNPNAVDPYSNPLIDKCFDIYDSTCSHLLKLHYERRDRKLREEINEFLIAIDSDIGYFQQVCEKADKLRSICEKPIDFKKLINCHTGIFNGKYEEKSPEAAPDTTVSDAITAAFERRKLKKLEAIQLKENKNGLTGICAEGI